MEKAFQKQIRNGKKIFFSKLISRSKLINFLSEKNFKRFHSDTPKSRRDLRNFITVGALLIPPGGCLFTFRQPMTSWTSEWATPVVVYIPAANDPPRQILSRRSDRNIYIN